MALCTITGTVYLPSGELARSKTIAFRRSDRKITAEYLGVVLPTDVLTRTDVAGLIEVELLTGVYTVFSEGFSALATVPDAESAYFSDIIALAEPVYPAPTWLNQAFEARNEAVAAASDAAGSAADAAASADEAAATSAEAIVIAGAADAKADDALAASAAAVDDAILALSASGDAVATANAADVKADTAIATAEDVKLPPYTPFESRAQAEATPLQGLETIEVSGLGEYFEVPAPFAWPALVSEDGRLFVPTGWPTPEQFGSTPEDVTSDTPSTEGQRFLGYVAAVSTNRTFGPLTVISRSDVSPASNGLILRANKPEAGTAIAFWKHPTSGAPTDRIGQFTAHGNAVGSLVDEMACYTTAPSGALVNRYKVLANTSETAFILTGCTGISRSSGLLITLGESVLGGGRSRTRVVGGLQVGDISPLSGERFFVAQDDDETGVTSGLNIRQNGSGDALVQFVAGGRRIVTGIDNSDGQKYKISRNTNLGIDDLLELNPTDGTAKVFGDLISRPATGEATLSLGQLSFRAVSNTELHIRYRGTDGTVRAASLPLTA